VSEPQDAGRERARRWAIIVVAGAALALVGALVGPSVFVRNTGSQTAAPGSGDGLQVVEYERPSAAGDDPFTTVADVDGEEVVRFRRTSGSVDNAEPYGGSGSLHVCDREALVEFLLANKKQRQAWAGVLGIDSDKDSVSHYIRSLTPVTLTVDTRVTNHDFVNGRAVPFQSILAAGTAVLVDKYGRPVVRCKCGNPLTFPKNYPKIRCKGCPPDYKPPKPCKWRIYDPWYPYPPDDLPPEWRDPYPPGYPKPKPWVYKDGKYCYIIYPDPPEIDYPPRWYPPDTYTPPPQQQPRYYPQPAAPPDDTDDSGESDDSDHDDSDEHTDEMEDHDEIDEHTDEEDHSDEEEHDN
jgi:hypothetical protein